MKKGLTELVFILDKSGSMGGLEHDTIGGYNSMLEKQKAVEGECYITTVLFDNNLKYSSNSIDFRRSAHYREGYAVGVRLHSLMPSAGIHKLATPKNTHRRLPC